MTRAYKTEPAGRPPKPTSAAVTRSMRSNRGSGTKPELILARMLRRKLVKSRLPGSPDFVYPRAHLAVFVHGDFWHRNPAYDLPLPKRHKEFWRRKFARNVERDQLVREELEAAGWRALVVWESEVERDPLGCVERIRAAASASRSRGGRASVAPG